MRSYRSLAFFANFLRFLRYLRPCLRALAHPHVYNEA
jgi:hypothetical protein